MPDLEEALIKEDTSDPDIVGSILDEFSQAVVLNEKKVFMIGEASSSILLFNSLSYTCSKTIFIFLKKLILLKTKIPISMKRKFFTIKTQTIYWRNN